MRLIILASALLLASAGAAQATVIQPYAPLAPKWEATNNTGCTAGQTGYSYSGIESPLGGTNFQVGVDKTIVIEPMRLDMTGTNGHSVGFWGVTSKVTNSTDPLARLTWMQVGVGVGLVPGNGYNNPTAQYFGSPHMFAEYNNAQTGAYYFQDQGPASGYGRYDYFTLRYTGGTMFSALINGVVVVSNASIPVGIQGGRYIHAEGEDLSRDDAICEAQDLYFEAQYPNVEVNQWTFTGAPLDVCAATQGNGGLSKRWETWNTNYGPMMHGLLGGAQVCRY